MTLNFISELILPIIVGSFFTITLINTNYTKYIFFILQCLCILICGFSSLNNLLFFIILFYCYSYLLTQEINSLRFRLKSIVLILFISIWFYRKYFVNGNIILDFFINNYKSSSDYLSIIGISYIGFKILHMHVDSKSGSYVNKDRFSIITYLLFFPSIVAGPIQRYENWDEQFNKICIVKDTYKKNIYGITLNLSKTIKSIFLGLIYKFVLANILEGYSLVSLTNGAAQILPFSKIYISTLLYPVYLFFDFAGYSYTAIGIASLFGISLPINFNEPFKSRNLAEFWNRWHITLSEFLRDYIYFPLKLYMHRTSNNSKNLLFIIIPPLFTFLLAGIWHGLYIHFIFYGILQGVGLGVIASVKSFKLKGRFYSWWRESKLIYYICVLITYMYISFSFAFFALNDKILLILYNRIFNIQPIVSNFIFKN